MNDPINAIIFTKVPTKSLYLVGGYLRDVLRGVDPRDRDFIVKGEITPFVVRIQKILGGTIIEFKQSHTIRLALKNGQTIDFSPLEGSLRANLSQRDFTINSIAWSPEKGLIDPFCGVDDLEKRIVRCISPNNLKADPLRMLRAYRCAAEMQGSIDQKTRNAINTHHSCILSVSSERITLELFHLLNVLPCYPYLELCAEDSILGDILSLSFRRLTTCIQQIHSLEERLLHVVKREIKAELDALFSQNLTKKGLLCLELLVIGKRNVTNLPKLSLSQRIKKRLAAYVNGRRALLSSRKPRNRGEIFDFFLTASDAAWDVMMTTNRFHLLGDLKTFQGIWKKCIVSSEEIMDYTGIRSGPELGEIIRWLKKAQFTGVISSRDEALAYLHDHFKYFT